MGRGKGRGLGRGVGGGRCGAASPAPSCQSPGDAALVARSAARSLAWGRGGATRDVRDTAPTTSVLSSPGSTQACLRSQRLVGAGPNRTCSSTREQPLTLSGDTPPRRAPRQGLRLNPGVERRLLGQAAGEEPLGGGAWSIPRRPQGARGGRRRWPERRDFTGGGRVTPTPTPQGREGGGRGVIRLDQISLTALSYIQYK